MTLALYISTLDFLQHANDTGNWYWQPYTYTQSPFIMNTTGYHVARRYAPHQSWWINVRAQKDSSLHSSGLAMALCAYLGQTDGRTDKLGHH